MTTEAFAPAKINLTLHVTGQRADGYHLLDSLVVFAEVGDRLWFDRGPELALEVMGPFAAGVPTDENNLVWRAAVAAGWTGQIRLEKNLPHGGGIGGGSSDAAALLRGLFGDDAVRGIGAKAALDLGADVPVCLHVGVQRMRGIGEDLTRLSACPVLDLVLVSPGVHLPTPAVFGALQKRDKSQMQPIPETRDKEAFINWLRQQRNDLQDSAISVQPVISQALDALADSDLARMSGSGATCFGIYADAEAARQAAAIIRQNHPDWWVVATRTTGTY